MPKALILANSSSGLYDFRNELLLELMKKNFEIVVSIPDDLKSDELREEGCKVIHTDINRRGVNPVQDLALFNAYRKLLKSEKPDIVITYTIKPNIYGGFACRIHRIPYIATVTGLGATFERGGLLLKLSVIMYKVSLKKCRCLFFQNNGNRKAFEDHGIKALKHVTVNGSGVNLDKHTKEDYPEHKDGITRFLYVGRFMKVKGTDELLYAIEKLHDKYDDKVSFTAIGYFDEDYEEKVKAAQEKGILKVIPYQKNIHPYMKEADAIVHPTYSEGMSNVLMEASATGRPVLASDIDGCREVVNENVSGYLFKVRDGQAIVDAVDKFMALDFESRKAMGNAARAYVEQKFDRRSIILSYVNEIDKILV